MTDFTPFSALLGGALIGAAAALLMLFDGRIAGISGILGRAIAVGNGDRLWRAAFLVGLPVGASAWFVLPSAPSDITVTGSAPLLVIGGLLVGFGTRLGSGCTSGHGVCGLSRLSFRSLIATGIFLVVAMVTVAIVRHVWA